MKIFSYHYRAIHIVLIAIPVVVFFWLLAKDFAFSGRLVMVYDFSRDSPFVKRPWPPGRLHPIEYDKKTRDYFQRMFVEPVTFDVKLPRKFKSATVELVYKKDTEQQLRLGIRMHPKKWAWEIRDLEEREEDGWTVGRVVFENLSTVDFAGNKLHFLVNAPGLFETKREILLTEIRVVVEKEPVQFANFFQRLWHWVWR